MINNLERRFNFLKNLGERNRSAIAYVLAAIGMAIIANRAIVAVEEFDRKYVKPERDARTEATATAIQARQILIQEQFEKTGGVNIQYIDGTNQILLTLNESAQAAPTRQDVISRALQRVAAETNCSRLGPVTPLQPNPGENPVYSVSTQCD